MTHFSVALLCVLSAGTYDRIFETGFDAYESGDYGTAIQSFEQLIENGVVEPEVFYNLGNAYYRAREVGPAIANYERALHLQPGMLSARENLSRAVNGTERRLSKPQAPGWDQALLFWDDALSPSAVIWIGGVAWILFWTSLGIRRFRALPFLRRTAAGFLVVALACAGSFYAKTHPQPLAVAIENRVPVHYGTSDDETVRFELYEGDRVLVDAREEGWARVMTGDGERGWARIDQLALVGPPYEPGPLAGSVVEEPENSALQ